MRVCVLVEPKFQAPPEMMPKLLQAMGGWREKWRSKMSTFEFWAGAAGGMAIVDVANETELSQMMMEFPFGPFSDIHPRLITNGDDALKRLAKTMQEMMAQMGG